MKPERCKGIQLGSTRQCVKERGHAGAPEACSWTLAGEASWLNRAIRESVRKGRSNVTDKV